MFLSTKRTRSTLRLSAVRPDLTILAQGLLTVAKKDKNNPLAAFLIGPAIVCVGVLALWENEGRFNFYKAARNARIVASPEEAQLGEAVSMTDQLETKMPIAGLYTKEFSGYYRVRRSAKIYSWERDEDSEGHVTWDQGWHSYVQDNNRNTGLRQTLSTKTLFPAKYQLGELEIAPQDIQLLDASEDIDASQLELTKQGQDAQLTFSASSLFKGQGTLQSPKLGDERVDYTGIPNAPTASYFGVINQGIGRGKRYEISDSFVSSLIQNNGILHHLANGPRDQALDTLKGSFTRLMWYTRLGGTVAVVIGIAIFLSSFVNLLYSIPIIGRLVSWGVLLISLILGLSISLMVIVTSALLHHPLWLAAPLVLLVGAIYFIWRAKGKAKANAGRALDYYQQKHATEALDISQPRMSAGLAEESFRNLAKLASEGGLGKKENQFLVKWGEQNGIDPRRMHELVAEAQADDNPVQAATRDDFILLICLALVDGMLSSREQSALTSLAKQLGLTSDDVREIIVAVESGELLPA